MDFPKRQILDSSKLKEFADDDFRFDENGRKLSKRAENAVGEGEIARYEQKTCTAHMKKPGLVWERIKGQPISRRQILDSSKLKEFTDDNFKYDESGSKLSKRV